MTLNQKMGQKLGLEGSKNYTHSLLSDWLAVYKHIDIASQDIF